ncbi:TPA: outer membrane protein assembly factor [Citrobacter amalonaticus]|nr:outer membrane protein assembly factor [Citrobacter amalonaticus]
MCYIHLLSIFLLFLINSTHAADLEIKIKGISGELEKNVLAHLARISNDEIIFNRRGCSHVEDTIRIGLRAHGYYEPTVTLESCPSSVNGSKILIATVIPNNPVIIGGTTIQLRGEAQEDPDYLELLNSRPSNGTILNHGDYDSFRSALSRMALRKGYFDGSFKKNQLGVALGLNKAFWDIDYDSGERYKFGHVTFEGSQISDEYLQNLVPFREGDKYDFRYLAELNRRLSATGWFNSAVVAPQFTPTMNTKKLPMKAVISPRTKHTIETGVGMSTDTGPRISYMWRVPWINAFGHSMSFRSEISQSEQLSDFNYKIPLLHSPLEQYYLLRGSFNFTNVNDSEENSFALTMSRLWERSDSWQRAINLRWEQSKFTQGNVKDSTMLLYPGITIGRVRSRDGFMPAWGDMQRYTIDYSNMLWRSDINFMVFQSQNAWIRTFYDHHRFVGRLHSGWIETGNFSAVPPHLRFFAGGDRSIRGYSQGSISPRDSQGKLQGASKLLTGSLEYQYNFSGRWWGAMFVDGGEATNRISSARLNVGSGIGIRWRSPVGPIRLDLATPLGNHDSNGLQIYIGVGPEL